MIDHVDIRVRDLERSRSFYAAVLTPLGFAEKFERTDPAGAREIGFGGPEGGAAFALHEPASDPGQDTLTRGAHIAFVADDPDAVQAFHRAGVDWGATDIGAPGRRPEYSELYYGAFLLDPDGNNVEAVCDLG